jgi:TrmH family RNA methyltransferase
MIPISQAKIKFVQSLKRKKYRLIHNAYVLEGLKACETAISAGVQPLFGVTRSRQDFDGRSKFELYDADEPTMKSLTSLSTLPNLICVFPMPEPFKLTAEKKFSKPVLFLDRIQDPGNLGTIVRTADWYGVEMICLNKGCVDVFNPKSLQSAMGSHVNLSFLSIEIDQLKLELSSHQIVGLDMEGFPLNQYSFKGKQVVLVIGNEGQGLSPKIQESLDVILSIPGASSRIAESLNAAIAAAISLDRICL